MSGVLPYREAVMRRSIVALIPILGLVVLGACSNDRDTTGPRLISPQQVTADVIPACDFPTMSQDAKNYFPSKDIVFTQISSMKTAYKISVGQATPVGFDILTRVSDIRRAGQEIGNSAAGGKFVDDVVGCMDVGVVPTKFQAASSLAAGVFEVRGAGGSVPAVAYTASGTPAPQASPLWGAEPSGSWSPAGTYGRYLVYGYPYTGGVLTNGFELGTLPDAVSASPIPPSTTPPLLTFRVGLCIKPANASGNAANRLVHLGSIVTGVDVTQQGASFCTADNTIASLGTSSWLARAVNKATSLLSPKSLYADDFFGIGGLPDGWSPFNFNSIAGSGVALTFGPLPVNVKDSTQFTLVVHASTTGFANVPGVSVALTVANNSGTPAQAVLIPTNPTAITDKNGDATFHIAIGKPGGYTLTATGTLSGVNTPSVTSAGFNIKN